MESLKRSFKIAAIILLNATWGFATELVEIETQAIIEPALNDVANAYDWSQLPVVSNMLCQELGYEKSVESRLKAAKEEDFNVGQSLRYFQLIKINGEEKIHELNLTIIKVVKPNHEQTYLDTLATGGGTFPQSRWVYFKNDHARAGEATLLIRISCKGNTEKLKAFRMRKSLEASQKEWEQMSF